MRSLGVLGAFFGGAIAGAVIGLLLAPEKERTLVRRLLMLLTIS